MVTKLFFNHAGDAKVIDNFFRDNGFKKLNIRPCFDDQKYYEIIEDNGDVEEIDIVDDAKLLIFVHSTTEDDWLELARLSGDRVQIIFMSREGKNKNVLWPSNVHSCFYHADELNSNARVAEFIGKINSNNYHWGLLSPEPYPDHLIALYLLDIARMHMENSELGKEVYSQIVKKATEEYFELANQALPQTSSARIESVRQLFHNVSLNG